MPLDPLSTDAFAPPGRVVIRPDRLRLVAERHQRLAASLSDAARRIRVEAATVALNPADHRFDPAQATTRQQRVVTGLGRSGDEADRLAGVMESTARQAEAADDGPGRAGWEQAGPVFDGSGKSSPLCRLPDRIREPVDRLASDLLGDGLEAAAAGLLGLAADGFDLWEWVTGDDGSGRSGDPGGTFTRRTVALPGEPSSRAGLVGAALAATGDESVLAHDEFGLIYHGRHRYTVVLPGVIDLSRPHTGWNPDHRSIRDLDQAALGSSRSSAVGDNPYARLVADALAANQVPAGAELVIIGHSFGADTALDLAGDPAFTARYRLHRVVATGYNSQPQLGSVADGTEVLVVQNHNDLVVAAESLMPTTTTGVLGCPPRPSDHGSGGTPADSAGSVVIGFDGGWNQLGHGVDAYRRAFDGSGDLDPDDQERLDAFIDRMTEEGFRLDEHGAGDGAAGGATTMLAIDVSAPGPLDVTPSSAGGGRPPTTP